MARAAVESVEVLVLARGRLQGADMFDHAITGSFYNTVLGSPSSVTTPVYSNRPASLLVPSNNTNVGVRNLIAESPICGWTGFLLRLETLPTTTDVHVAALTDAAGTRGGLYVTTGGVLTAQVGSGTTQTGPTLVPDEWYWVEMIFNAADSGGTKKLYWRTNQTDYTTASLTEAASTVASVDLASYTGDGVMDWYSGSWWWGSAATTSEWVGPIPRWHGRGVVSGRY